MGIYLQLLTHLKESYVVLKCHVYSIVYNIRQILIEILVVLLGTGRMR